MDSTTTIAAWPWLVRLWRMLPGPRRIPLLVIGAVGWFWRSVRGENDDPAGDD